MAMEQEIRYLDFDGRRLAYSTYGDGPPILVGPRWVSHLEEEWADPDQRPFYVELARTHRVVRFDRLGCGLSDRVLEPRPTHRVGEPPARGGDRRRRRRAPRSSPRSCCCLAASQLAVRDPLKVERIVFFGALRKPQRHPRGDARLARPVHADQLGARRADVREPVRPARRRRRPPEVHAHAAQGGDRRGGVDLPRARSQRRSPRRRRPGRRAGARPPSPRRPDGADRTRPRARAPAAERALRPARRRRARAVEGRPARALPRARRLPARRRRRRRSTRARRSPRARPRCCGSSRPACRTARSPRRSCSASTPCTVTSRTSSASSRSRRASARRRTRRASGSSSPDPGRPG